MLEVIKNKINDKKAEIVGEFKKSAVTIFITEEEEPSVVFEIRSLNLKNQPGDVCLPGGKIEKGETPREAAKREAMEELNLKEEDFEIIGELDYVVTPYSYIIYTFVATLNNLNITWNTDEVDHIFKVPLSFFLKTEPEVYYVDVIQKPREDFPFHLIKNGTNYKFREGAIPEYFYKFGEYVIWGYTALIIKSFLEKILKEKKKD